MSRLRIPDWLQRWSVPLTAVLLFALAMMVRAPLLAHRLKPWNLHMLGSDRGGYQGAMLNIVAWGDFSTWLLGARPPLYPLMGAAVYKLGGGDEIIGILQIIMGSLTVVVGYLLARRLFARLPDLHHPERLSLIAGLIMALDPASVAISATLLAEPLFNLCFLTFFYFIACYVQTQRWLHLALSALFLALTMLARATGIYLWVAAAVMFIPLMRRWWRPALALAITGLVVYLGWSVRNLVYVDMYTYSTQPNFTMLFYRAISAEHLATGREMDDLRLDYMHTLDDSTGNAGRERIPDDFWAFLVAESPEMYDEMGKLAISKLIQYWPYALAGTGIGFVRMYAITQDLPTWFYPIEIVYHALLYGTMLYGVWKLIQRREWHTLIITGMPIAYVTGLTLISQTSGMDTRMRTMLTAPIVILSVYGAHAIVAWVRQRGTPNSLPAIEAHQAGNQHV